MEKKKNNIASKSKNWIVLIVVLLLIVSTALAWFISTNNMSSNTFGVSNFKAEADCFFMDGNTRVEVDNYLEPGTNLIELSTSSSDENFIGNFRVNIIYSGKGYGYLRAKVVTEAKDSSGYSVMIDSKSPSYTLYTVADANNENNEPAWFDNRNADFCYYYKTYLYGYDTQNSTLSFITGVDSTNVDTGFDLAYLNTNGYTLYVAVETDMVQINRYPQIWGINSLPWE